MENKTMKEITAIAKDLNITLSYKCENGTRKRYTKNELIVMINQKLNCHKEEKVEYSISQLKELISIGDVSTVNSYIKELQSKKVKGLSKSRIDKFINIVKSLLILNNVKGVF